jgi:hypothetical protein
MVAANCFPCGILGPRRAHHVPQTKVKNVILKELFTPKNVFEVFFRIRIQMSKKAIRFLRNLVLNKPLILIFHTPLVCILNYFHFLQVILPYVISINTICN